jgi:hypothetical protein
MATTPWLSFVTIDPQRNPKNSYRLIRELSPEEYAEYKKADERLSQFLEDPQKIRLLREAYNEYKSVIESNARRIEARKSPMSVAEVHSQDLRAYHQINAKLRGFLSEMTTYLNYAERYLKREYGHDSEQVKFFKARTNKEYDTSPSYRYIYQLRNYALHYDVPINDVTVKSGGRDLESGVVEQHVRVEIDRDKMLNSGFDWKKVRPDIEAFPLRFALDPHLDHMIEAFGRIALAVIVGMLPDLKKSARYIDNMVRELIPRFEGKHGSPLIVYWEEPPADIQIGEPVQMNFSAKMLPADLARGVLKDLPEPHMLAAVIDDMK